MTIINRITLIFQIELFWWPYSSFGELWLCEAALSDVKQVRNENQVICSFESNGSTGLALAWLI